MNNKYYKRWKISEPHFGTGPVILCYWYIAAGLTRLSRRSISAIYGRLRCKIAHWSEQEAIGTPLKSMSLTLDPNAPPANEAVEQAGKRLGLAFLNVGIRDTPKYRAECKE